MCLVKTVLLFSRAHTHAPLNVALIGQKICNQCGLAGAAPANNQDDRAVFHGLWVKVFNVDAGSHP